MIGGFNAGYLWMGLNCIASAAYVSFFSSISSKFRTLPHFASLCISSTPFTLSAVYVSRSRVVEWKSENSGKEKQESEKMLIFIGTVYEEEDQAYWIQRLGFNVL